MPITNINRTKAIALKMQPGQGNIITAYQPASLSIGDEIITGYKIISFNSFIKNLKAFAKIKSLAQPTPPTFELTDSNEEKTYKMLAVEWGSPRFHLNLFLGTTNNNQWELVGSVSLLNPSGYPYRVYNLLDLYTDALALELGQDGRLGLSIDNVGYGYLSSEDIVSIHGSYTEEIFVRYDDVPTIVNVYGGSTSGGSATSLDYSFGNNGIVDNNFLAGN